MSRERPPDVPLRLSDFAIGYRLFAERERASGEFARGAAGRPDTRQGDPFFLREENRESLLRATLHIKKH